MQLVNLASLELAEAGVERWPDGLPRGWPLFRAGDNYLTVDGCPANLNLSEADLAQIVQYHQTKGVKIPIDSSHVVSNLAGRLELDEAELLRKLPRLAGVAGFGGLAVRDGALCLCDVEWNELGAEVLKSGLIRYYSPTIRGLDGKSPLRVTSVALTNAPRLNHVADLAASDDDDDVTPEQVREIIAEITKNNTSLDGGSTAKLHGLPESGVPAKYPKPGSAGTRGSNAEGGNFEGGKKEAQMPEETNPAAVPPVVPPEAGKKPDDNPLLGLLKEILGDDVTPENLKSKLAALKAKADSQGELAERVKKLECSEETRRLSAVREKGLADGKLTAALLEKDYFRTMTAAELSEYCDAVPAGVAAPVGVLELGESARKPVAAPKKFATGAEAIAAAETIDMEVK